jgi:hypothetical protein
LLKLVGQKRLAQLRVISVKIGLKDVSEVLMDIFLPDSLDELRQRTHTIIKSCDKIFDKIVYLLSIT